MRRREFIGLVGGAAAAWPLPAAAQIASKPRRIGILVVGGATPGMIGPEPENPYVASLLAGLRQLGWVYGRDFTTEPRGGAAMPERYAALCAEVVALKPDVIVAAGPMLPLLKRETSSVPVVMTASDDPVGEGLVKSLAEPGGNFTGLSHLSVEIVGKRLELLSELSPAAFPVAVLWDWQSVGSWRAAQSVCQERAWPVISLEIKDGDSIEAVFQAAADAHARSLLVFAAGRLFGRARQVAALAISHRLPAMYHLRPYVEAGGLISYSTSLVEIWRRGAVYVDRILKGADPARIPVEQPTRFELVINLKTANALGIAVPPSLLSRADEVIE
jgi:putative ABC transport system substrate-binding protein